jgi:toxin CptA
MKPLAPFPVALKPSQRLLAIQSLAHLVAAGAALAANLPAWLAAVCLLLVGASMAHLRHPLKVSSLVLGGDGAIEIVGADGTANEAVVHPHTVVLSFLVVLLYRSQGRLRALTLLGDSLAEEDFRQLRLWLRWRSTAANPV